MRLVPARSAVAEIEIKRSRFLAQVSRVEEEEHARAVVATARREHFDARHHCSAFVLADPATERSSDDGEPSGTAGAPMLNVIRGAGLSDVVVVVTRWFGGTLLGAGGLVRAYSEATRAGIEAAGTLRRERLAVVELVVSHAEAGRVENELRSAHVAVLDTRHDRAVTLRLGLGAGMDLERLRSRLAATTHTPVELTVVGDAWVDRPG